ncbi:hypothetical protein K438DRAFT_1761782 [Mycena galopus ATCC 62051]|nr:hypothetical protein K438DRAFT_1761782 [Mycena galopus ATCC 62051]
MSLPPPVTFLSHCRLCHKGKLPPLAATNYHPQKKVPPPPAPLPPLPPHLPPHLPPSDRPREAAKGRAALSLGPKTFLPDCTKKFHNSAAFSNPHPKQSTRPHHACLSSLIPECGATFRWIRAQTPGIWHHILGLES